MGAIPTGLPDIAALKLFARQGVTGYEAGRNLARHYKGELPVLFADNRHPPITRQPLPSEREI